MGDFVHLHLHSKYSFLDGAIKFEELFPVLKERGMDTVALTDHGNMHGALDFYLSAKKAGIKPIIGCEAYIAPGSMDDRSNTPQNRRSAHLVLLARNQTGLKNLQYLVSMASVRGFYYKPRMDLDLLRRHSAGLVGLSACLAGDIAWHLRNVGYTEAKDKALEYASIFEDGWFFLELQHNGLSEQEEVNEQLIRMSGETRIPLVATNDCHYIHREDAEAQGILMRINTNSGNLVHEVDEFYVKSAQEMIDAFSDTPEAIENTVRIAEACDVEIPNNSERDRPVYHLPHFPTPEGLSEADYLRRRAHEGLAARLKHIKDVEGREINEQEYYERLEYELDVIIKMGFPGYFLIVSDFISWAKDNDVPVGPGRGSGAGSLVAYSIRITDLDPIYYGLLFERFLNPERISMPDFDVDFCKENRWRVLEYVKNKYGENNVAQIATFGSLKAKQAVRDVGRVLGFTPSEMDRIAKKIPGDAKNLEHALSEEPALGEMMRADEKVHRLFEIAKRLEGLYRQPGMHAAGVVIAEEDIWEYVPVFRGKATRSDEEQVIPLVTQYDKDFSEMVGLVKFDFLGLDNLTIIHEALERINAARKEPLRLDAIPLDDPRVFEMLSAGLTDGVFQMESPGFKRMMRRLKPDKFEDLIAAVALYRPGPLNSGMVDDYIRRKHGEEEVQYLHPMLSELLEETYGVMVYQEQIMLASRILANFTMGQADTLRKAMGKKKADLMAKMQGLFVDGCAKNGISEAEAKDIWRKIEEFASYGFNKSHSAAYALIAYQTAYLKAHYPVEYMAGILSCERTKPEKVMKYLMVARSMGIDVLSPDVNESIHDFAVVQQSSRKAIRFGLEGIKGVGSAAVEAILEARADGPFSDVYDFFERVRSQKVNKAVIETLVKAGAFDSLMDGSPERTRAMLIANLEALLRYGADIEKSNNSNMMGLFDALGDAAAQSVRAPKPEFPRVDPWDYNHMLRLERDALGIYLTGHPLDPYLPDEGVTPYARVWNTTVGSMLELQAPADEGESEYYRDRRIPAVVVSFVERKAKTSGAVYGRGVFDGKDGLVEFHVRSNVLESVRDVLSSPDPVLVEGDFEVRRTEDSVQHTFIVRGAKPLARAVTEDVQVMRITLPASTDGGLGHQLDQLRDILNSRMSEEGVEVFFAVEDPRRWRLIFHMPFRVKLDDEILERLRAMVPPESLYLGKDTSGV